MLELDGIDVDYADVQALRGFTLSVAAGEIVTLVDANGAGKTTTRRTISGLLRPRAGAIRLDGARIDHLAPDRIVERGLVQVPEGWRLFPSLTVRENLELGADTALARAQRARTLEAVLARWPVLGARSAQRAGTLSGSEQQMLAIGRALMARPALLMLDEPSQGLAPPVVRQMFGIVADLHREGTTLLLVEQNVRQAWR